MGYSILSKKIASSMFIAYIFTIEKEHIGLLFSCATLLFIIISAVVIYTRNQQKRTNDKIREIEQRHNVFMENAGDAIVLLSIEGKVIYASPSVHKVVGYTAEELLKYDIAALGHPDDRAALEQILGKVLANPGVPISGHTGRMLHKDGTWHWYEAVVTNMLHDPAIGAIVDNFRDVTDRVLSEEKIINVNRLYSFISHINHTIVHTDNALDVFKEACRIAVELGKFKMAWIGLVNFEDQKINLVAGNGIVSEDEPKFTNADYDAEGPLGYVVATGRSFMCNDIEHDLDLPGWKEYAAARGLRSFMILPIKKAGKVVGAFSLYASQANLFDAEEIRMLEEVAGDISFAVDVFEKEILRKASEERRIYSEMRLTEAQAIAHLGSWEVNFATGVATWSDETCRIYGLPLSENIQSYESWFSFIHPEDLDYVRKTSEEAEASLSGYAFYNRIIRKDGTVRHLYSKTEFDFVDGKPVGLHGIVHDITGMKEAEVARSQSEANLLMIMDIIPQSIFVKNFEGEYLFVNKSFAALYDMSPEELIHRSKFEKIDSEMEADIFLKQDQEVITTGIAKVIPEVALTRPNSKPRYFYTMKVPYTLSGMNETGVLGIALDITDQKIANTERENLIADLVQRNKDLEQFSFIISHNLRAPVSNILGITEIIKTVGIDQLDATVLLRGLDTSVKRLDQVITDLNFILQLNRKEKANEELVRFSDLLDDIKTNLSADILNDGVQIRSDFSAVNEMFTSKGYLYSIFFNLISNSIKYKKVGLSAVVNISSSWVDNKIQLLFKDNGLGMDIRKKHHEVFGLYKRFHNHVEGKGLGLYMVKTQVESLRGKITVESEVNKGAEFKIEFENQLQ